MSGEKPLYSMVTEEPGKTPDVIEAQNATEDDKSNISTFPTASSWLTASTSWGSSWFNSAREKTMNTLDLVRKDLSEFTEAMSQEVNDLTSAAKGGIDSAANVVKQQAHYLEKLVVPGQEDGNSATDQMEGRDASCSNIEGEETIAAKVEKGAVVGFEWMMSIVDSVADTVKTFAIEETTQGEDEITEVINPRFARRTRINPIKLLEIQNSEVTYLSEPENKDVFISWISKFNINEHDGEINMLLGNNPRMRQIYTTLVPSKLDAITFWCRYFFAVQLAEMDEEMKQPFILQDINMRKEQQLATKASSGSSQTLDPSPKNESDSDGSVTVLEQPTSPAQSTDDWSVCSEKNDVEEINNYVKSAPLTPRAKDDFCNDSLQNSNKKEDGWVDWDE